MVADGFYEWRNEGKFKQPFWIRLRDERPFAFAGLWDAWRAPDGSMVETCAILTTEANDRLRPLHDRMPVILEPQDYRSWLDSSLQIAEAGALLRPLPSEQVKYTAVSTHVNRPENDDPTCIERWKARLICSDERLTQPFLSLGHLLPR